MTLHTRPIGANVLLARRGKVLLFRRANTGWADGMLGIPGGHLEAGETARQAAVREIQEEAGIALDKSRLHFFATAHVHSTHEYIYQEFYAELKDDEEPINAEPQKCSELIWCDPAHLPGDIPESFRAIIQQGYVAGERYMEIGYT